MGLFSWFTYSYFGAWLNGRIDGKKNIPTADQEDHSPYEKQLTLIADENIRRVTQKWDDEDRKLKGEYCGAKREYIDALKDLNKDRDEHGEALQDYEAALKKKHESSTYPHLSHRAYWAFIILLSFSEFPLTAFVFDILGENRLFTYIFAAALCIALPMASHFLGIFIREQFSKKNSIIAAVNLLLFVGVIVAIAYLREKFFEASEFQKVLGVQMDPATVTIVFIFIQLFIFGVATTASYLAHDPHPQLKRAKKEFEDAKNMLQKESREVIQAEERVDKAAEVLVKIEALRVRTFEKYQSMVNEIAAIQKRLIEAYRTHNLRHRNDLPKSFKNYPSIEIPHSLQELDVDCGIADDMEGQYQRTKEQ
jgi:hypothetical protein